MLFHCLSCHLCWVEAATQVWWGKRKKIRTTCCKKCLMTLGTSWIGTLDSRRSNWAGTRRGETGGGVPEHNWRMREQDWQQQKELLEWMLSLMDSRMQTCHSSNCTSGFPSMLPQSATHAAIGHFWGGVGYESVHTLLEWNFLIHSIL